MSSPKLDLYYFDACPFCQYVLRAIQGLNIKVNYMHIYDEPKNMEKLMQDTGRKTTPCLYIDGNPMFESQDIIDWLEKNQDNLEKN
jgi:glutaredoxin